MFTPLPSVPDHPALEQELLDAWERERTFQRLRIANFLYTLEYDSRRVKVTDMKLEIAEKKPKPHEVPADEWFFDAEVTSRQRADG